MQHLLVLLTMSALLAAGEGLYDGVTQGALRVQAKDGRVVECPLRHTGYRASIAGLVAQVEVVQTFVNPFAEAVEAVYVFPLSHASGINGMTMEIGERRLVGALLKRADARAVYEQAKVEGKTASLLDQERPNIFTQSVGNLPPGGEVRIRIAYVEQLAYDRGAYAFHLPLVVGPRYMPGSPLAGPASGTGIHPDTDRVADAARISPPVLLPGQRTGHDVSIAVTLDAGIAIRDLVSANHQVAVERPTPATATITLQPTDSIPNKDFVMRYAVAGAKPEVAAVSHVGADGGWLLLAVQPAQVEAQLAGRRPRDLCFLVDVSGSMSGEPIAKVREAMRVLLAHAGPEDRVQVITFAGHTQALFPSYLPASPENIAAAQAFSEAQQGGGGTNMREGVRLALDEPLDSARMRMVVMLTDGYIGNEAEIVSDIGTRGNDRIRFWCIGIGSSPNRFLVDGVATAGGGMGVVLGLNDDSTVLVDGLMSRIQSAQLDRVSIDWGGLPVSAVVPQRLPSLWSGRPLLVNARFAGPGVGVVTVRGEVEGRPVAIPVTVTLPERAPGNQALRTLWARQRLGELRYRATIGDGYDLEAAITTLSLEYGVMTEYTSFVAVDERVVNPGGRARQVNVAVPLPEGVSPSALPVLDREQLRALGVQGGEAAIDLGALGGQSSFMAIGVGGGAAGMYGARSGGGRKRAVGMGGGSKASESCVDAGLRFLKRHQQPDGSWDPTQYQNNCTEDPKCEPGQGGPDDTIALTAQTLLTFLGAGYDHKTANKYKPMVQKGLAALLARQQADGSIGGTVETQALATKALAEAYAMTSDPDLRKPAQLAMDRLLALRVIGGDGRPLAWGQATVIDTMSSVWAVMAMKSAFAAGLQVGDGLEGAKRWLEQAWMSANPGWQTLVATKDASVFPAQWSLSGGSSGSACEAGAVAAVLLGRKAGDQMLETLAVTIGRTSLAMRSADLGRTWLGTVALFQVGGEPWRQWNTVVRDALVMSQRKGDGCFDGSWDAQAQIGHGHERGRLQSSVHAKLCLEVYYAYALMAKPPASPGR